MRIVSQEKSVDVPYDLYIVGTHAEDSRIVVATNDLKVTDCYLLGKYDSETRALEVMAEIRECYKGFCQEETYSNFIVYEMPEK